jgi:hypothetical protein
MPLDVVRGLLNELPHHRGRFGVPPQVSMQFGEVVKDVRITWILSVECPQQRQGLVYFSGVCELDGGLFRVAVLAFLPLGDGDSSFPNFEYNAAHLLPQCFAAFLHHGYAPRQTSETESRNNRIDARGCDSRIPKRGEHLEGMNFDEKTLDHRYERR